MNSSRERGYPWTKIIYSGITLRYSNLSNDGLSGIPTAAGPHRRCRHCGVDGCHCFGPAGPSRCDYREIQVFPRDGRSHPCASQLHRSAELAGH
ncbi:hypothetical protein CBS147353_9255 [Aspergillus niger]|nr:hypothetical protein CBS147353_9255 [Aspergillus niger]